MTTEPRIDTETLPRMWVDLWKTWARALAPEGKAPDVARWLAVLPWPAAWDYWVDACQRTVLFWDVMRGRGNMFLEHEQRGGPPVLLRGLPGGARAGGAHPPRRRAAVVLGG